MDRACANATIGQNKVADDLKLVGSKFCPKHGFARPDFSKYHHIRCFKTTVVSLLNREGHVLAWPTGTTFLIEMLGKRWLGMEGNTPTRANSPPY